MPNRPPLQGRRVLLVDDEEYAGDWLVHFVSDLGCELVHCFAESRARDQLRAIARGEAEFALAVFDLMVPTHTFEELLEWDGELKDSMETGLRLCEFARSELAITESQLPILTISSRSDEGIRARFEKLGIPFFDRTQTYPIRKYISKILNPE